MCGFCGYYNIKEKSQAEMLESLKLMNAQIAHRGPDGDGFWQDDLVGLAHRRLSIIDLEGGHQPLVSSDGRYKIVYNGEIYNYKSLRSDLLSKGYQLQTNSDTEVIPYVIQEYGVKAGLNKLRGMFAIALYDAQTKNILLARDYVGIKPLYYSRIDAGGYLFGSELKSLATTKLISNRANTSSIIDFFITGHTFSPNTAWEGVTEVPPGTYVSIDKNGIKEKGTFWEWQSDSSDKSDEEWIDLIEQKLLDSVEAHMVSDVPVTSFLSGGVDSSLIVAMVCKHYKSDLDTFNVGFDEKEYDESPFARIIANHTGSNHHEIKMSANQGSPELFERIINQYDQPFGDSSSLPTYLISKEISQYAKVVLSGDGGDEMFGGYQRYQQLIDIDRIKKIPFSKSLLQLASTLSTVVSKDRSRQFKKLSHIVGLSPSERILSQLTYFNSIELNKILKPGLLRFLKEDYSCSLLNFIPSNYDSSSQGLIETEINGMLHADYLRKVDIASMAHSIEVRTPFLDKELFDLSMKIPLESKLRNRTPKYLLKKVAERYIPAETIYRQKQGFGLPFDKWAASKEMRSFIGDTLNNNSKVSSIIHASYIEKLLSDFQNNKQSLGISRYQTYQRIFMFLSLELWLNKWNVSI